MAPGRQYRAPGKPEYDHNLIVNKYTVDGKPRDWDIFWCFILDPALKPDLRSERELLLAKHQTFRPSALFEFKDVPSHALMAERLSVKSMADLKRFRRKDGTLPRLLILPARLAVRATAEIRDVTIAHPHGRAHQPRAALIAPPPFILRLTTFTPRKGPPASLYSYWAY